MSQPKPVKAWGIIELINLRITAQIQDAEKHIRGEIVGGNPEYAKGEILGLTSLREFIEATIPEPGLSIPLDILSKIADGLYLIELTGGPDGEEAEKISDTLFALLADQGLADEYRKLVTKEI
jgi:hypothetical protein